MHGMEVAGGVMPAIGFALIMNMIGKPRMIPYTIIGFILVKSLGLNNVTAGSVSYTHLDVYKRQLFGKLRCSKQVKRNLSALLSLVLFIAIVCFLLALLIPQLVESIASLVKSFPGYAADFQVFAIDFMKEHDINVEIINKFISDYNIVGKLTEFVTSALPQMAKLTYQLGSTLLNVLLGIISGLYLSLIHI